MSIEIKEELLDIEGIKKSNKNLLDLFIRRTAVLTSTPEYIVEKIVKDQWRHANKQTQPGSSVAEIDFCNLGTFFISPAKAKRKITNIEKKIVEFDNDLTTTDLKVINRRIDYRVRSGELIKEIKTKIKDES